MSGDSFKKKRQPKAALESRTFKDGAIYLFKRADYKKPTWFCRIKVPHVKGYVYGSTKTTDEHQAYAFADKLYIQTLGRVASGQDISSKKVSVAIKEYDESLFEKDRKKPTSKVRLQFLHTTIEFFGSMRLKEINTCKAYP